MAALELLIEGPIWPESYIYYDEVATSLARVRQQVDKTTETFDSVLLNVFCCPGGYCTEGWAIVDYLLSLGVPIDTRTIGQCASFGTTFASMGRVREVSANGEWLIHRPWGGVYGNDIQVDEYSATLKVETSKMFRHYSAATGLSVEALSAFIGKDDVILTPEELLAKNFATKITGSEASASVPRALLQKQNPIWAIRLPERAPRPAPAPTEPTTASTSNSQQLKPNMADKKSAVKTLLDSFSASMTKLFTGEELKALKINVDSGQVLDIAASGENDTPVIGDDVKIDSEPAEDGTYTASADDKTEYTVASGKLSKIETPETESASASAKRIKALQAKHDTLEKENKRLKDTLTKAQADATKRIDLLQAALGSLESPEVELNADTQEDLQAGGGKKQAKKPDAYERQQAKAKAQADAAKK